MKTKKIPLRMCIACRQGKQKKELLRVVAADGELVVDETGKAQGRGAYICPTIECLDKARKSKAFNRTLDTPMSDTAYNAMKRVILRRDIK